MSTDLRQHLQIHSADVDAVNRALLDPDNALVNDFLAVVAKYGTPEEINAKALAARQLPALLKRLEAEKSPYLADLQWLIKMRDEGAFVSVADYRAEALAGAAKSIKEEDGIVMEISACQYFPWLMAEARHAIKHREIMPGRYIRVRNMVESAEDMGDLIAMMAAMEIIGASYVETLDTRGTDGSNIHLNGPETIAGYFTSAGQPNDYPLKWIDEFLHYYTQYGVQQVLNINPGTMLLGYWLSRIGVDIEFKVSVFAGTDNAWSFMHMLTVARLYSRPDGFTPLVGMNPTNAVNADTLRAMSRAREAMGMTEHVRIEHHVTNFYKHMVRQPYLRRDELVDVAAEVRNMAAKHEGGDPSVEEHRTRPSDVFDYFRTKADLEATGDIVANELSYMDKHEAINRTARALTQNGYSFGAARKLHR